MTAKISTSTEDSIALIMFDLVNFMIKYGETLVLNEELTAQQWLVLSQIAGDPNFPQPGGSKNKNTRGILASEIATSRGVSRANISAMIASLLRKQLVRQVEDPKDRRRKFLKLTAKGEKLMARIEPKRRSNNAELFEGFSTDELQVLHGNLQRCLEKFWQLNANRGNGEGYNLEIA